MPNRLIHECALTSRKINQLTDSEEKFWWRLILCCDDFGCFFGEPDVLRGKVYPRQKWVSEEEVLAYRNALIKVGLVFLYTHEEEIYLCINKWDELQTVRTPRRKYPEPTRNNRVSGFPATICDKMLQTETDCDILQQTETDCNNVEHSATICDKMLPSRARAESNPIQSNTNPIHSESDIESESENESKSKGRKRPKTSITFVQEVIEYLNTAAGTGYKATTKATQQKIKARQDEGFTLEDFKTVIKNKVADWKKTEWEKYLRPETLFGTKFESYLNQKQQPKTTSNPYADMLREDDLS